MKQLSFAFVEMVITWTKAWNATVSLMAYIYVYLSNGISTITIEFAS